MTHTSNTGAVAIVTGGTSGIGVTIAQRLVAQGMRVLVTGRSVERGERVVSELGDAARFVAADLNTSEGITSVIEAAKQHFGRIDVLVNNAAIDHTNDLLEVTDQEIRDTFETNTFGAMNMLIAAARVMREQGDGGAIINVTSRLASIGVPTMGIYSASKGAMLAFTKAAAIDLAQYGIRVNAVAPGMTATPLYEEWIAGEDDPAATAARVAAAIPLRRIAQPQDVAATVAFLASAEAEYLTGVSIPVDGGYLAQ
ncbi:SDR family NAD(P)-dependent oxidoreductase [Leucobacter sp. HY1908]